MLDENDYFATVNAKGDLQPTGRNASKTGLRRTQLLDDVLSLLRRKNAAACTIDELFDIINEQQSTFTKSETERLIAELRTKEDECFDIYDRLFHTYSELGMHDRLESIIVEMDFLSVQVRRYSHLLRTKRLMLANAVESPPNRQSPGQNNQQTSSASSPSFATNQLSQNQESEYVTLDETGFNTLGRHDSVTLPPHEHITGFDSQHPIPVSHSRPETQPTFNGESSPVTHPVLSQQGHSETSVSSGITELTPITSSHCLAVQQVLPSFPENLLHDKPPFRLRWELVQHSFNAIWHRFLYEYLPTLNRRTKWWKVVQPLQEGDVVLSSSSPTSYLATWTNSGTEQRTVPRGQTSARDQCSSSSRETYSIERFNGKTLCFPMVGGNWLRGLLSTLTS